MRAWGSQRSFWHWADSLFTLRAVVSTCCFHSSVPLTCCLNLSRTCRSSPNWFIWTPLSLVPVLHVCEIVNKIWHFWLSASTSTSFSRMMCDKLCIVSLNTSWSQRSSLADSYLFSPCSFTSSVSVGTIISIMLCFSLFRLLFSLVFSFKTAKACSLSKAYACNCCWSPSVSCV